MHQCSALALPTFVVATVLKEALDFQLACHAVEKASIDPSVKPHGDAETRANGCNIASRPEWSKVLHKQLEKLKG